PPLPSTLSLHDALPILVRSAMAHFEDRHARTADLQDASARLFEHLDRQNGRPRAEVIDSFHVAPPRIAVRTFLHNRDDRDFRIRSEEHTSELQSRFDLV